MTWGTTGLKKGSLRKKVLYKEKKFFFQSMIFTIVTPVCTIDENLHFTFTFIQQQTCPFYNPFHDEFTTIHASFCRTANLLFNINMNMNDSQQSQKELQQSHRRRMLREEETDDEWDDEMLLDGTALNTTSRNQNGNRLPLPWPSQGVQVRQARSCGLVRSIDN